MKKFGKEGKSKKKIIILVIVLVVIAAVGVSCGISIKKAQSALADLTSNTGNGTVTKMDLTKSIGATGKIVSVDKKDISVSLSNVEVAKMNVEVGDYVTAGDELAVFDTSDIENSLSDTQRQYNATVKNNSLSNESQEINAGNSERNSQSSVDSAYNGLLNAQDNLDTAKKNLEDAKKDQAAAQEGYSLYYDTNPYYYTNRLDAAKTVTENAEKAVTQAERALSDAQKAYDNALASKESNAASTENSKASSEVSQSVSTIQYESQIRNYKEQLEKGVIVAPISGLVTAVKFETGDIYTGGTIITIQNTSAYEVETEISEYDIADIELGQKVLIKTDATGNEEMTGQIVKISPVATTSAASLSGTTTTSGSSVTYTVRVSIDNPSERLRLDMNASLSIILEEHAGVMTVPYNAIQTDENGNTYVTVIDENAVEDKKGEDIQGRDVPVTIVMESNYYTEITSDELKEGDNVVLVIENALNLMEEMMSGGF